MPGEGWTRRVGVEVAAQFTADKNRFISPFYQLLSSQPWLDHFSNCNKLTFSGAGKPCRGLITKFGDGLKLLWACFSLPHPHSCWGLGRTEPQGTVSSISLTPFPQGDWYPSPTPCTQPCLSPPRRHSLLGLPHPTECSAPVYSHLAGEVKDQVRRGRVQGRA